MRRLAVLCLLAAVTPVAADDYPTVVLKNDALRLTVYPPDPDKGFYRGTRFDWSGVIGKAEFAGQTVFGRWHTGPHNAAGNDDITGPCEEFGMHAPIGYAEAGEGGTFLKVGVGELRKGKEEKYNFFGAYKIVSPGKWKTDAAADRVTFTHDLAANGYGYRYLKVLRLEKSGFVIDHSLTNAGAKPFATDHYNHNFFIVNDDPIGPNYTLRFPFPPSAPEPRERFRELVTIDGPALGFRGPLDKGSIYAEKLQGLKGDATDNGFTVEHRPSGVRVAVAGDRPLLKYNLWATTRALCPEPFVEFKVAPGETQRWAIRYEFSKK